MIQQLATIREEIKDKTEVEALRLLAAHFPTKLVFSTSLGYEDQVITHLINASEQAIDIFTLDTGRLYPETYSVLQSTRERYNKQIKVYYPQTEAIEKLLTEKGPLSFYESVENRKACCSVRKVEPLTRALKGYKIWITGIRAEQSPERMEISQLEWDEANQIIKYHPLLHWSFDQVKNYIRDQHIPYNALHDKGFVSIGCAPCTRAIKPGEDFRAGRWWWEDQEKKECGLHSH